MASSYPHSMAPCRWFSNRKDCIWKHKPTIYTPNKQWDVNLDALTHCNLLLLTHPPHPSFAWFCYGAANTPFVRTATWNWSLILTHCWATKTAMLGTKRGRWAWIWWRSACKNTSSLQLNASTNYPFSHDATFKSIIWTRQLLLRQRQQACESTRHRKWGNAVSVCVCVCLYWIKTITNYLNKARVEVPGLLLEI